MAAFAVAPRNLAMDMTTALRMFWTMNRQKFLTTKSGTTAWAVVPTRGNLAIHALTSITAPMVWPSELLRSRDTERGFDQDAKGRHSDFLAHGTGSLNGRITLIRPFNNNINGGKCKH